MKVVLQTVLLASLFLISACQPTPEVEDTAAPKIKQVSTIMPITVKHQASVFATGILASKEEIKLSFKTGGVIQRIHVQEGQHVREGQLLASLKLQEISAQVQQAEIGAQQAAITVENAKLALTRAERDLRNTTGLFQDSVATLEQFEDVELQLKNAQNQLQSAEMGLKFSAQTKTIADFNLQHSRIYAPKTGTILKKVAQPSELIAPGMPVFLFGTTNKLQVIKVNITDKDIIHLALGDTTKVHFDAYPSTTFEGTVQEIASAADPYTSTYEVEIEVAAGKQQLFSGFIGQVEILTKRATPVLQIPVDALISADKRDGTIFIAKNGRAQERKVEIFKLQEAQLLIRTGLKADEKVIVKGAQYLDDGDLLRE